jgi:hypothetical protein
MIRQPIHPVHAPPHCSCLTFATFASTEHLARTRPGNEAPPPPAQGRAKIKARGKEINAVDREEE